MGARWCMRMMLVGLALFCCARPALAEDPSVLRDEAKHNVQVAFRLMTQAQDLLKSGVDNGKVRAALSLYIEAGKLLERSLGIYKALVPNYASEQDLQYTQEAMRRALNFATQLKQRLNAR